MRLVKFSVSNYRSITNAHQISLGDITVLVGRNNEGKSNFLKAISLAMSIIERQSRGFFHETRDRYGRYDDKTYIWERDFPITKQINKKKEYTVFNLEFELNETEQKEFKKDIKIKANKSIPITIKLFKDNNPEIKVPKKGSSSFKNNSIKILEFISNRTNFNNIPAIRTERDTIDSIQRILYYELSFLEKKKEFKDAIKIIEDLQKEVLIPIEQKIKKTLQEFLPNIKDVQISKSSISRRMFFSLNPNTNIEIMVDDGNLTSIEYKGDGVKSLASLAMLKDRFLKNTASIIAIEEPEAHLHPEAIHQLIETINSLSVNNQIIITTHNPLFIQRNNLKSNVIIKQSIAKPAKDIKEIRETLGVLPEDNLINASFVLVVEGLDDKIILMKLLPIMSSKLKKALMSNFLVLENIDGAGNLSSKLTALRNNMCKYFVFLDNDDAGLEAAKKAKDKGLLLDSEVKYTIVNGSPQAELEDCLNPDFYRNQIKSTYKVNLDKSEFKTNKKWSERMKKTFYANGQDWNDKIETNVKMIIAECTPNDPKKALISQKCSSIDSLIKALESLLKV